MQKPNHIATVGQLRAAIEAVPDDTPLVVNAENAAWPEEAADQQVITSTGFGLIDWGDGYGLEPDTVFALNSTTTYDDVREKPVRPVRQAAAEPAPVAEPEAGL